VFMLLSLFVIEHVRIVHGMMGVAIFRGSLMCVEIAFGISRVQATAVTDTACRCWFFAASFLCHCVL
jgi:hypothetical protein